MLIDPFDKLSCHATYVVYQTNDPTIVIEDDVKKDNSPFKFARMLG